jgi:uncharacterized protein (TIGR02300 family)
MQAPLPGSRGFVRVAKPKLGTKRICPNCGTRYYDLNKDPIICPKCGTYFEAPTRGRPVAPAPAVVEEVEEVAETAEAEFVTLEAADEEAAGGAEEAEGEDVEIEPAGEEETFLEEEEEGEDDVGDIIGDVEDEEET